MDLQKVMEAAAFKVGSGSDYLWDCFGSDARTIDFSTEDGEGQVIFSAEDQTVFEVTVCTKYFDLEDVAYRWRNPDFIETQEAEALMRNVDNSEAWDDVRWIDLDVEEDILEKLQAILAGEPFDSRVMMVLNITDEDFLMAAKAAHHLDITVNEFCAKALTEFVEEHREE